MVAMHTPTPVSCTSALQACLNCSIAADAAKQLGESMVVAASDCRDLLLRSESLIQLGLVPKPRSNMVRVPHVRQAYNWDCGLACALMVLRAAGINSEDFKSLGSLCPTTSIWTVDLAYILRRFGLSVEFTTITLGANPDYAKESFYKEHMVEDGFRVERLFLEAPAAGIAITRKSVRCRELKDRMLLGGCVVIALVDMTRLAGHSAAAVAGALGPMKIGLSARSYSSASYTGHYIIICGYDSITDRFMIQDPATTAELNSVTTANLEAARHAYGTDEDLLLVTIPSGPGFGSSLVSF